MIAQIGRILQARIETEMNRSHGSFRINRTNDAISRNQSGAATASPFGSSRSSTSARSRQRTIAAKGVAVWTARSSQEYAHAHALAPLWLAYKYSGTPRKRHRV